MTGYALANVLHVLAVVIWVGGMFFAWAILRPAANAELDDATRLRLWPAVLGRFFPWVWASIAVVLVTGFYLIFGVLGGMGGVHPSVHTMLLLGIIMMLIFAHIYFAPYRRLKQAAEAGDVAEGLRRIGQIRLFVAINTVLGLVTVAVGSGGRLPL